MGPVLGGLILLVAAVYAAAMTWLRAAWIRETAAPKLVPGTPYSEPPIPEITKFPAWVLGVGYSVFGFKHPASRIAQERTPLPTPNTQHPTPNTQHPTPTANSPTPPPPTPNSQPSTPTFSVLIAARNEAAHLPALLAALAAQTHRDFEVLIADDHSTDGTAALLRAAAATAGFPLRVVPLLPHQTGKKAALAAALALAEAPWLVCTDADCHPGPGWLAAYAAHLACHPAANFVSGPVRLTGPPTLFQHLLHLEFAGLVGVGAACLARQHPTMCNGANLAYRRAAFAAVGGFADTAHLASGDDEFLLHAIHARFPGTTSFLFDPAAVVETAAPATLAALLRQRVRWASKWRHYRAAAPQHLALLVLTANVALAAGLGLVAWQSSSWPWVAAAWATKLAADAGFMAPVLRLLGQRRGLWLLPVLQLAYAPYALGVGLTGLRGSYGWKDRRVR